MTSIIVMLTRMLQIFVCMATLCAVLGKAQQTTTTTTTTSSQDDDSLDCGLYLAKSTIPHAGVGIFTANELKVGHVVGFTDLALPFVDFAYWYPHDEYYDAGLPFADYVWDGTPLGMSQEHSLQNAIFGYCPGMDAAINFHAALVNTEHSGSFMESNPKLNRNRHAGAGAVSLYQMHPSKIVHNVPAGGELFKSYGNDWFTSRTHVFGPLALPEHYDSVERLCIQLDRIVKKSTRLKQSTWDLVHVIASIWNADRLQNAMPPTMQEVQFVARNGIRALHQPNATRPLQHLQEHGRCMDHIGPGPASTMEGAGRGAFATRFLKQGTIITASPLIHVYSRQLLNMMDADGRTRENVPPQILLNYCYGHNQSTLLLCPYGAGVGYINHNNNNNPNVKITWTPHGVLNQNDDMFTKTVQEMKRIATPSLSFDYVATRDITKGEELFLNYGMEWQQAWDAHLLNWKPWKDDDATTRYVDAQTYNRYRKFEPLLMEDDVPSNLQLKCHLALVLLEHNHSFQHYVWEPEDVGLPCTIMDTSVDMFGLEWYTVTLWLSEHDDDSINLDELEDQNIRYWLSKSSLTHVSRTALRFHDKIRSNDHHLPNAFRHPILIPDDMFPDAWRNLV